MPIFDANGNLINGTSETINAKISGLGIIENTITSNDYNGFALCAIKQKMLPNEPSIPAGYVYHSYNRDVKKLYYSPNQIDKPTEIATLGFSGRGYVITVSPNHGTIFFAGNDNRRMQVKVYSPSTQETTDIVLDEDPFGWLQNCGCDFGVDGNGNEYFMFGEYTGYGKSVIGGDHVNIWKVEYPYTDSANWRVVKSFDRTDGNGASEAGKVWHIHTCQRDPYTNVWYATTGDTDMSCTWWYSTDDGETWNLLLQGDVWESQVVRVLNFVFTEDYIYWANDYGTNHCLNRITRNSATHIIDVTTRVKLAELNKNQSTYATIYCDEPRGIITMDRVDTQFARNQNYIEIPFYNLDTNELSVIGKLYRKAEHSNSAFGLRCKCYTLRQSPFEKRIACGFDSAHPNLIDIYGNESETLATMVFELI